MSDKPPKSPMSGTIWSNYTERLGLYREISFARSELRDRRGTRTPYTTIMMREGHAILSADRRFFEAARAAVLAEREAIAESLEQAGRAADATLVRGRPAIVDWQKP